MKKINLTKGQVAIVDDNRFDELNNKKWYAHKRSNTFYAVRCERKKAIHMHHQVTGFKYAMIDHINGDGLDNRECNLRPCTRSENGINSRIYKNNKSGLRGVFWHKRDKKWHTYIRKNGTPFFIGYFDDKEEAGRAYRKKAIELFGEFAVLNFPDKNK